MSKPPYRRTEFREAITAVRPRTDLYSQQASNHQLGWLAVLVVGMMVVATLLVRWGNRPAPASETGTVGPSVPIAGASASDLSTLQPAEVGTYYQGNANDMQLTNNTESYQDTQPVGYYQATDTTSFFQPAAQSSPPTR